MKAVYKRGQGPYQLTRSHTDPPLTHHNATSRWSSFGYKHQVMPALLDEQFGLCCYTEIRPDKVGLGFHIEHVENKSQHPQRTFDYMNLAASALSSEDLLQVNVQAAEVFGGHAAGKSRGVDLARFVSCHQPDCARFFAYLSDGRVVPARGLSPQEEDRARYTIALLNLNSPYLQVLREAWWDELDDLYQWHLGENMDLSCLIGIDLVPVGSKVNEFFSITRAFYGRMAEEVLERQAPELR